MSEYILEVNGIEKAFPGVKALDNVNLKIKKESVHAIVGENGAGKSTLMLTLGGVYRPDKGNIKINGKEVRFSSPIDAREQGISVIYQELSVVPNLSIAENIFAHRQPVKSLSLIDFKKLYKDTTELLKLFNIEHIPPDTLVKNLSIAHQQIVEILKAISTNPQILILDEPTSSLTESEVKSLFKNIRALQAKGISFIYISHHLSEIFEIADTVTVLRDGKYICDADVKDIDENFLINKMVGRSIVDIYGEKPKHTQSEKLFEAKNLSIKNVFENINFYVNKGEIVGFAGLVGAGRTEVGRAIFGAEKPDKGSIYIHGKEIKIKNPKEAIKEGIAYLTEDRKTEGLYLEMPIYGNIVSPQTENFLKYADILDDKKIKIFADEMIKKYNIVTPSNEKKVGELSGGNQQKTLFASWLGIKPKFLIVDEPTRGVDVGAKSDIYKYMRTFAAENQIGILLISSDLTEILGMSDRIYVMKDGSIKGEIDAKDATEEKIIALASGVSL